MRLNQVTVPSTDVDRSIKFYTSIGLELIVHTHDNYARLVLPDGGATFSISKVDALPEGRGIHIYFEVDDLQSRVELLKSKGIEFLTEPEMKSWLWAEAHLLDPDGNYLIIYHAGENRLNPPWRINVSSD